MKLSFEHISKLYGNTAALQQIDLTLGSGVYGLLGPNGAGKTTLMRIMTDLLAPSTGRVLLDGQDIAVMGAAFRKKLGYLPQDFGVYPNFTAEQFLLYIARLKGLSKFEAKRQTDGLLHMVGLEDKKQKKLKGFSGGQRQRVGIAQAPSGESSADGAEDALPKFWCWTSRRRGLTRKNGSGSAVSSVIFPSKSSFCCRRILYRISKQSQTKSFCSGKVLSSKCKSLLRCWSI